MANDVQTRAASRPGATSTPRWALVSSLLLCVLGLAISAYLTYEHVTAGTLLACPDTAAVSCTRVTTSSYSSVLGIPVAVLGLAYFAGMTILCAPASWRSRNPWWGRVRVAAAGLGAVTVCYLVWAELFGVGAICLWCTAVHAITVLLFGVVTVAPALAPAHLDPT